MSSQNIESSDADETKKTVKQIFKRQVRAVKVGLKVGSQKAEKDSQISRIETQLPSALDYVKKIDQALKLGKSPKRQLKEARELFNAFAIGINEVAKMRGAPDINKKRTKLYELFKKGEKLIFEMKNQQPAFDLDEPDTWEK